MTSPDPGADTTAAAAAGNSDAPVADVPWGKTEYVTVIASVGSLLNGYLGQDYGLSKNAQALSVLVGGLLLLGHNVGRALKHRGAMRANAAVYTAQLQHVAAVLTAGGGSDVVGQLAAGVQALNTAVTAVAPAGSGPVGVDPVDTGATSTADPPALLATAGADGIAVPAVTPAKKTARRRS